VKAVSSSLPLGRPPSFPLDFADLTWVRGEVNYKEDFLMKYFHSGFLFTCGCILALLLAWLIMQFFVRLKLQEIHQRGQPRMQLIQWQAGQEQ
jgi:hypothetical protein